MNDPTYNHYDPAKAYERLLFRPDRVIQSAELNEMQSIAAARLRGVADVLFKEGDIVNACQCVVDANTGAAMLEAGALYVSGAVRGVGPGAFTVPTVGAVYVGVYLQTSVVTELEDPGLYNPAAGTRGYGEAGAGRERITLAWGQKDDGTPGSFYPVWTVVDGTVMPKEPPPNIDAVTQAIARYDRDSAGGTYVIEGMEVIQSADLPTGQQVYSLREGSARIGGNAIQLAASRRLVYDAQPDLQWIDSEPHTSTTEGAQRVNFDRSPAVGAPQVRVQARRTVSVIHGGFTGAADPLPDNTVLVIDKIEQGGTVFAPGADYVLTAGQIDWSPSGAEPAPGSAYSATYQYMLQAAPQDVDASGCTVAGALPGTLILLSYHYALRRYDRLVMNGDGSTAWVRGVPAPWSPKPPATPASCLLLATVYQSWDANRRIEQDQIRVVPMQTLNQYRDWIAGIYGDLAELRLYVDAQGRHSGVKKGLFADAMLDDSVRDAGVPQTAFIMGGWLQLPMGIAIQQIGLNITEPQTTAWEAVPVITQGARTGSMLVNPYSAFDALPCWAVLTPSVDYWSETDTQWANPLIRSMVASTASAQGLRNGQVIDEVLSTTSSAAATLRPIVVNFSIGFPAGDTLHALTFDGVAVDAQPLPGGSLVATKDGLKGQFQIPEGIQAGAKIVRFTGNSGNTAEALFVGQGTLLTSTMQKVTIATYDPLAETFTLDAEREICGVDLWFTARGANDVHVQLRTVQSGVPSRAIVAECILAAGSIATGGPTRAAWPPALLAANQEYALVVLTNDPDTALAVADLGAWDEASGQWVSSQPYQVGVLLSSSNASTWTAHQTRDMTFALLAARHTESQRVIDLGQVAVQEATDLVVLAGAVTPAAGSGASFALTLDDGAVLEAAAGQSVQPPARYTGNVKVSARLTGGEATAGQLLPGMQLLAASVQPAGDYVSPAINAQGGTELTVILEALLPAGSALTVQMQAVGSEGWVDVPYQSSSPQTAGVLELTYHKAGIACDQLRVRALLTGSHAARPLATNLRAFVI
ncbi:MAG: DUF4815 domain-containing protein [Desulfovibrionaceae bacterium]|jgi:hypothetical protein|nr:DUF4815 domain-containing protein [Desulfovibrionaceae bacterium]